MVKESYQEKLGRQFARYAAGMALFFFTVFTVILLVYTLNDSSFTSTSAALFSNAFLILCEKMILVSEL